MTKRIVSLTSVFLVAVGLAVYTGSALAGNGKGDGNAATASGGPGNSENAPGQGKKEGASTEATANSTGGSVDQNSAGTTGVKPTSGTAKDTNCSTTSGGCVAPASEGPTANAMGNGDASKRYGNDQTAAQIATASGAPVNTNLHGPGNSQPHKVALCPGGHEVDVHALKAKGLLSASCGTTSVTLPTTTVTTAVVPGTTAVGTVVGATPAGTTPPATTPAVTGVTPSGVQTGGVAGVTASQGTPAGGVLGAIEAVGQGILPFTGFPLWVAVASALALIALGLTLRRRGRALA
jgi:hypothetical protein